LSPNVAFSLTRRNKGIHTVSTAIHHSINTARRGNHQSSRLIDAWFRHTGVRRYS